MINFYHFKIRSIFITLKLVATNKIFHICSILFFPFFFPSPSLISFILLTPKNLYIAGEEKRESNPQIKPSQPNFFILKP